MTREEANKYFPTLGLINKIFDDHEAQLDGLKQCIQKQSNLLEMYSKDNEVPNNALLVAQLKGKDEEIERLKEAMQEFVNRCEKGEVRSKYTYSKFKELLKDSK